MEDLKFESLMKEMMSESGYNIYLKIKEKIPSVWKKPSSASGKYHRNSAGHVNTIEEHTYEMVYAHFNIHNLFGYELKSTRSEIILLGIVLHDSMKYGLNYNSDRTDYGHDELIACLVKDHFYKILSIRYNSFDIESLSSILKFHSGRFGNTKIDPEKMKTIEFYVHMLDMLSSKRLIDIN